jgi:two-component system response regulator FixJ
MPEARVVYVIDDEKPIRDSVTFLLELRDLCVESFSSADEFIGALPSLTPGCVLTDVRMPGMDGLNLLRHMKEHNLTWPVVVMTAHGEVPLAVRALKTGASDFIEKPFTGEALCNAVMEALQTIDRAREQAADISEITDRLALLTAREREVLEQLMAGNPNKLIAYNLGVSPRTVEVHRGRVMGKMRARSVSALVRMAITAGVHPLDKAK